MNYRYKKMRQIKELDLSPRTLNWLVVTPTPHLIPKKKLTPKIGSAYKQIKFILF
jgi:hypothetical protein